MRTSLKYSEDHENQLKPFANQDVTVVDVTFGQMNKSREGKYMVVRKCVGASVVSNVLSD
jgi:hypothetical protein